MTTNDIKPTPIYDIGDTVTYRDKYWGKEISGTVTVVGYQGNKVIYGLVTEDVGGTVCLEKDVLKRKSTKKINSIVSLTIIP